MQLSVTCPRCQSKYQLAADMRGKRMRCPNTICRAIFEVRDDSDPVVAQAPPAPPVVEAPKPVQRKPIPKPIEPQPTLDIPDDFPGDEEAAPEPTAPAIATEAWQPEALPTPVIEQTAPIRQNKIQEAP